MKNNYSADFEIIWSERPKRAGGNPKLKASKAFSARLKDGHTTEKYWTEYDGMQPFAATPTN